MEMQNKAKSVQFMPQVSAKSVVPMFVQNKPNYQRFQSKIKGCSKNKAKVAIHGHSERSEESLCAKQSQLDIATMKKQNEPKRRRNVPASLSSTPARRDVQTFTFFPLPFYFVQNKPILRSVFFVPSVAK